MDTAPAVCQETFFDTAPLLRVTFALTSSWDYRRRSRPVLHSCQLTELHHCQHPRSHLRDSPPSSRAWLRPPRSSVRSFPRSPTRLDSSPVRAVLLWFPWSSTAPWCNPPFPSSRL